MLITNQLLMIQPSMEVIHTYSSSHIAYFGVTTEIPLYPHTLLFQKASGLYKSNQFYICAQHIWLVCQVISVDKWSMYL